LKPSYPRNRIPTYLLLTAIGTLLDLVSKTWVFKSMGGAFETTGWLIDTAWLRFELHTSLNKGALWGMGQGLALWFAAISVLAFAAINYWLFLRGAARSLWLTVALSLVSGGTLGNLYDRLGLHGVPFPGEPGNALAVRDFLHFQFGPLDWATFNIADCLLVIGSIMLLLQSARIEDASQENADGPHKPFPDAIA
jgi:signal peptidase II